MTETMDTETFMTHLEKLDPSDIRLIYDYSAKLLEMAATKSKMLKHHIGKKSGAASAGDAEAAGGGAEVDPPPVAASAAAAHGTHVARSLTGSTLGSSDQSRAPAAASCSCERTDDREARQRQRPVGHRGVV